MKRDDTLWKSILEDMIIHFMHFFFEEADQLLDLKKKPQFLDKEMAQISQEGDLESPRFVDKLVKVFTRKGKENWVLIHIEIQGYRDPGFEERMYIYHYRIFDLYRKHIAAIVILSDESATYRPTQYYSSFLGTINIFQFKTYKILDQDEAVLGASNNPFAFVILTVLLALKKRKEHTNEEDLLQLKIALARRLLNQNFTKPVIRGLYQFLRNYVKFEQPENNRKFDQTINSITEKNKLMGIVEVIRERQIKALKEEFKEEYMEKGIEKGIEIGIAKGKLEGEAEGKAAGKLEGKAEGKAETKAEVIRNLSSAKKFSISEIAHFTGVTEDYVREVTKTTPPNNLVQA